MLTTRLNKLRYILFLIICLGDNWVMLAQTTDSSWIKQYDKYIYQVINGEADTLISYTWKAFYLAREHGDAKRQLEALSHFRNTAEVDSFPHYLAVVDTFPTSLLKVSIYNGLELKKYRCMLDRMEDNEGHAFVQRLIQKADSVYADSVFSDDSDVKTIYLLNNRKYLDIIIDKSNIDSKDSPLYEYVERYNDIIDRLPASESKTKINSYMITSALALRVHDYDKCIDLCERVKQYVLRLPKSGGSFQKMPMAYASICYYVCYQQIQCYDQISDSLLASNWAFMSSSYGHECRDYLNRYSEELDLTPALYYKMVRKEYSAVIRKAEKRIKQYQDYFVRRQTYVDIQDEAIKRSATPEYYIDKIHRNYRYTAEYQAHSRDNESVDYSRLYAIQELKERIAVDELKKQKQVAHRSRLQFGGILIILLLALLGVRSLYLGYKNRKKLIGQLRAASAQNKAEKEKTERAKLMQTICLDNMNHEIRSPLNSIAGFSDLLIEAPDLDTETKQEFAEQIATSSSMLLQIINDVLDTAQLESGQYKLENSHWAVLDICEYAIHSMKHRLHEDVTMRLDFQLADDTSIYTDKTRLLQILLNFLSNACKHTEEGSVTLSCAWEDGESSNEIRFTVCDTGSGVPADKQEHLFERFAKLNHKAQGTGLGLNIAATLAHVMHGKIGYDATYTEGACFYLVVPKDEL